MTRLHLPAPRGPKLNDAIVAILLAILLFTLLEYLLEFLSP